MQTLWQRALKKPMMTGLIGVMVGTSSAVSVPIIQATAPHRVILVQEVGEPSVQQTEPSAPPERPTMSPPADQPRGGEQPSMDQRAPQMPFQPKENGGMIPQEIKQGEGSSFPNGQNIQNRQDSGRQEGMMPPLPGREQDKRGNEQNQEPGNPSKFDGNRQGPDDNRGSGNDNGNRPNDGQDEERQKQDEERQKQMEKQNLARMKQGMKQAERGLTQMKKYFDKFTKKGIALSSECSEALAEVQKTIGGVQSATTMEEANEFDMQSIGDTFQTLNECRQRMEMLARVPQMLKQVDRQIKTMAQQWTRTKKNAPPEAADPIKDGESILQGIKDGRAAIDGLFKEGNVEDIESALQDGVFDKFDDLGDVMQRVEAVKNSKRFFAEYARKMKEAESIMSKMKRAKQDTTEAQEILTDIKERYAAIKTMEKGSEEFMDAIEELMQRGQDFGDAAGLDTGPNADQMMKAQKGGPAGPVLTMPRL